MNLAVFQSPSSSLIQSLPLISSATYSTPLLYSLLYIRAIHTTTMPAYSAAESLPTSGLITQEQATQILSHYKPDKLVIPEDASHICDPSVDPSHHSWDGLTVIGRLKIPLRNNPTMSNTKEMISRVESKLAIAFQRSEQPFWERADRVYLVEKTVGQPSETPFMLFTVAAGEAGSAGVYVATHELTGPHGTIESKRAAEKCLEWRTKLYDWSLAKDFAFYPIKEPEDDEDITIDNATQ
jgi:hypothetical protein